MLLSVFTTPFPGKEKAGFHYQYSVYSFDQYPNILTGSPMLLAPPHTNVSLTPCESPTGSLGLPPPWITSSVNTSSDTCRHHPYSGQIPTLPVNYTSVWTPPSPPLSFNPLIWTTTHLYTLQRWLGPPRL